MRPHDSRRIERHFIQGPLMEKPGF
jgi:hypothetical protein